MGAPTIRITAAPAYSTLPGSASQYFGLLENFDKTLMGSQQALSHFVDLLRMQM